MSSVSVFSSSSKDFAWLQQQRSSAYMNFREDVAGRSLVYMLKSVGAKTDPCGRPFDCSLHLLVSSPMWTRNLLSRNMNPTTSATQKGRAFASFRRRPVCQTVSYAAVRSSSTAPVFIFLWKPFSMKVVRARTWSHVLLPGRNPAWSADRISSTSGVTRPRMRRSRTLKQTDSNEIGL